MIIEKCLSPMCKKMFVPPPSCVWEMFVPRGQTNYLSPPPAVCEKCFSPGDKQKRTPHISHLTKRFIYIDADDIAPVNDYYPTMFLSTGLRNKTYFRCQLCIFLILITQVIRISYTIYRQLQYQYGLSIWFTTREQTVTEKGPNL